MRFRLELPDVIAMLVLVLLVGGLGTGLGVAAARVRGSEGPRQSPLRVILHGGPDIPSIQRDRVRLRHKR
jgi:hypothetical protein